VNTLGAAFIQFKLRLVMQDRAQQRTMHLDVSIVVDESKFAKLVHEMADPGSGGADHLRQRFLTDAWTDRLRAAFLPEASGRGEGSWGATKDQLRRIRPSDADGRRNPVLIHEPAQIISDAGVR
jgi:hypothetical protein